MPNGIQQYTKLEHRLVLLAWLNSLFGYASNKDLLSDCKEVAEGYASDGFSHLYHHLMARGGRLKIPEADLARYDENIRTHLERINRGRPEPITLRYFQHLAALLAFLFSYGEEPIILDQPEDDLDNHLIYDLIVGQLRRIKQRRQVIVVTHNANIVVNGNAELVVALAAHGGETQKDCFGCLQERPVRDTICTVMEGGREAFEQRWKRLGGGIRA